jgi:hypothetical protein
MESNTKWKFLNYMLASLLGGIILGSFWMLFVVARIVCFDTGKDTCMSSMLQLGVGLGPILGALIFALFNVKDYKKALKRLGLVFLSFLLVLLFCSWTVTVATPYGKTMGVFTASLLVGGLPTMLFSIIPAVVLGFVFTKWKK